MSDLKKPEWPITTEYLKNADGELPASALKFLGVTISCGELRYGLLLKETDPFIALTKAFPLLLAYVQAKGLSMTDLRLMVEERVFLPNLD